MLASSRIHALTARYVVPRGDDRAAPRLDRLLRRVLDEALGPALARAGLPDDAIVCVRRISSRAAFDLGGSDDALVRRWSLELSAAIAATVARAGADVVVFASPHHVLLELALAVAAADLSRAWAFRRLGLGDLARAAPGARVDLLVRALAGTPPAVAPLLEHLARRDGLTPLLATLTAAHWRALARAVGLHPAPRPPVPADSSIDPDSPVPTDMSATPRSPAPADSSPAPVPPDSSHAPVPPDSSPAPAPADRSPAPVPADSSPAPALPAGPLARALLAARAALAPDARLAAAALAALAAEPACAERRARLAAALARELAAPPGPTPLAPPTTTRPDGATAHGGLLFLVHILAELAVPATLRSDPALAARGTRWLLHRLALALLPGADDDDPAALAFAGLAPDAAPPARDQPPPSSLEAARLVALARDVTAALHRRLGAPPGPPPVTLAAVCRRPARVVADPGWFAVHLSLRHVDTTIRRAGLDLDPDLVPWLGVVLKFHYA